MHPDDSSQDEFESVEVSEVAGVARKLMKLYADRSSRRWIVLDSHGDFWELPAVDNPWEHRRPFQPTEDTDLDPVPGHYKHLLGLPF